MKQASDSGFATTLRVSALISLTAAGGLSAGFGQTVAPSSTTAPNDPESDAIRLSPFEVRTTKDEGYVASDTLAATRMNTELWDTPIAVSIFTPEFLEDTGVLDVKAALDYAMNVAEDFTNYTGIPNNENDLVAQIRGFVGATIGRNYFPWALSSDRFNIERLEFSRGPNSVLFGIGAPGGVINTSTKRARIDRDVMQLRTRIGSWSDYRAEADISRTLLKGKLAARMNLMYQEKHDWREFVQSDRKAGALAVTYRPFRNTEIRLDGEYGDVDQILAAPWPAHELFVGWVNAGRPIAQLTAPNAAGLQTATAVAGTGVVAQPLRLVWDPFSGVGPVSWNGARVSNSGGAATTSAALSDLRMSILDESIQPRNAAISGPGWSGDFHYYSYAVFIDQRVGDNFNLELAFNRQEQTRFNDRPQGFGQVGLKIDPNAFRPLASDANGNVTAWGPNPNVGKFYTESLADHRLIIQDRRNDDYRVTVSYRLDRTKRSKWIGRHDIAGLASRTDSYNRDDLMLRANLTPAGTAAYPLNVTSGNNFIHRRTYIDFSNPDPRWHGLYDYKRYPLTGQNGVTEGWVRSGNNGRDTLTRLDTRMAVLQSRWLEGRVVTTAGLRNDRRRGWSDTEVAPDRVPVTQEFLRRSRDANADHAEGDTRTYGVVVHPLKWLALFYNNSDSFRPQTALDINGNFIGNRKGVGSDTGVRVRLWDGRINASISRWKVDDKDEAVGRTNDFINYLNAIWAVIDGSQPLDVNSRDTQALEGDGWEGELTANPTRQWRLSLNVSQTHQVTSGLQPRNGAYIETHRALFNQHANRLLNSAVGTLPGGSTVGQALQRVDGIYQGIAIGEGQTRRQLREYNGNVFTTYTFRGSETKLRGLSIGGGAQYRGKGVVGYDTSRGNAPVFGQAYTIANAMASYDFNLKRIARSMKLQLNVDNLFNQNEPIVTDADEVQAYRYVHQIPRRYSMTLTVSY